MFELERTNENLGISVVFPTDITFDQLEAYEQAFLQYADGKKPSDGVLRQANVAGMKEAGFGDVQGADLDNLTARQGIWLGEQVALYIRDYIKATDPN